VGDDADDDELPDATPPLIPDCASPAGAGALPAAPAVPRVVLDAACPGPNGDGTGLVRLGREVTGSDARDCAVFSDFSGAPHGARRNRLRGRSLPNQPATEGPIKSASTRATPTPSAIRNQRTLKMLGWRRMR
jgi:hypothetical protein